MAYEKIVIIKGDPIPDLAHGKNRKYPWTEMEVGDSFIITTHTLVLAANVAKSASNRHKPKRFVSKRVGNDKWQIWRVA